MFNIFSGIILILFAIATYKSGTFSPYWGEYDFKLGLLKYPLSFIMFGYGIWMIINYKTIKINDENNYTICPNCKESFTYSELKDGKCKYCDDVDTIDIEEYYKNNPDEKE